MFRQISCWRTAILIDTADKHQRSSWLRQSIRPDHQMQKKQPLAWCVWNGEIWQRWVKREGAWEQDDHGISKPPVVMWDESNSKYVKIEITLSTCIRGGCIQIKYATASFPHQNRNQFYSIFFLLFHHRFLEKFHRVSNQMMHTNKENKEEVVRLQKWLHCINTLI